MRKILAGMFLSLVCCIGAVAWDCPTGEIRQQAPSGTATTTPYYDVVEGIAFICVPTPTATAPSATSNSTSGAVSKATATNTNTITNTLSQAQKQQQSQSNASTNNNQSAGGSVENVGNTTENIEAPKIPVASAYAPMSLPSAPCVKGFGAGVQTMAIGGSFGGSKIDAGCDAREFARSFALLGARVPACKILVQTKQARKAKITMEDCLASTPVPVAVVPPVVIAPPVAQPEPVQVSVYFETAPVPQVTPVVAPKPLGDVKPRSAKHIAKPCKVTPALQVPMEK